MEEEIVESQVEQPNLEQTPVAVENKKVKLPAIAILLIAILFFGAGLVYAGMQIGKKQTLSSIPTQVVQPTLTVVVPTINTPAETANWKMYTAPIGPRNISYQIRYPPDLFDIEFHKSRGEGEDYTIFSYKGSKLDEHSEISEGLGAMFWIVFDGPLEEPVENITINGIEARRYFHQEKGFTFLKYELKIPNTKDYFKAAATIKGIKTEELVSLFDQILSTFKFLE